MEPLPPSQWDDSLQHVIDDMRGLPLNVHSLMANHPELLNAWWNYRNYSVTGGALEQRDCELVILRVAVHLQVWYEWASHVVRGLASDLTMDEINRVKTGPSAAQWSDRDSLLLSAVDQLVQNHGIDNDTQVGLAEHFSKQQTLDVIAIHGLYITLGCMINTWGLELDKHVAEQLPEGVTRKAFEQDLS